MNANVRKILAVLVAAVIVLGWYVTIVGIGNVGPIQDKMKLGLDIKGGVYVVMEARPEEEKTAAEMRRLMDQTQAVIENRVNQLGLSEPVVTTEGENRIRVELPGAEDAEEAIEKIGRTAMLKFRLADGTEVLDGSLVSDAGVTSDTRHGGYAIALEFNSAGAKAFGDATRKAYNRQVTPTPGSGYEGNEILIVLDDEVISAPGVRDGPIENGKAEITSGRPGGFPQEEAITLAALIRGGALPVKLVEITSSTRTATIGVDALEKSIMAGIIGIFLIFLIMFIGYRVMGFAANIALLLYVILVLWVLVLLGGVLTLPGIAGIILSIGMAVDANVIIFARIREEIGNGKTVRAAIQSGFNRAMRTVIDAQVTTIIAALVLYFIGTSSVRGFALTLMIGIVISVFTAVAITRLYLGIMADSKALSKKKFFGMTEDNEPTFKIKKQLKIINHRKVFYLVSVAFIAVGLLLGSVGFWGFNYGIDFTGGTMMQLEMHKQVPESDIHRVLGGHGVSAEIVYAGEGNTQVIIRTMQSIENKERIAVIESMKSEFGISDNDLLAVDNFGPSVSRELRSNAIKAILIASIGMLLYIILRFEWKFGIAAIVGVAHDVLFVLAFYAIFRVTINNPFIAGILTVVGYSINDTIVVFDRIRENLGIMKRNKTEEIVDASINQTLVRSIMTAATTVTVMIPMLILTSDAIREFILPLMVGVIVGCVSSITVSSPAYYQLAQATGGPRYKMTKSRKPADRRRDE
ncbi:MAG: protein translocase subunit SecD [Clostridiales bacterium]|nr:protein translocase subunit SecD [Clostridiales bacterium]